MISDIVSRRTNGFTNLKPKLDGTRPDESVLIVPFKELSQRAMEDGTMVLLNEK